VDLPSEEGAEVFWVRGRKVGSFSGERAKVSLFGEIDRSTLRLGRGGTLGRSMLGEELVEEERTLCKRVGRWGTVGVAMMGGENDG
jgi:hypothetical protein